MNSKDRKEVSALRDRLSAMEDEAQEICDRLGELRDAEQEKFENMSEGLQQSESGQRIEAAWSALYDAATEVDDLVNTIGNVVGTLDGIE